MINLQLLDVDTTNFCGERTRVLRRWGFLHENTLSPPFFKVNTN